MFPIQLTLTLNNADELSKVIAAIKGTGVVAATAEVKPATKSKAKAEPQPETKAEVAVEGEKTHDDAADLIKRILKAKGRPAAVAFLTGFGVEATAKLKQEQLESFCRKGEALLAEEAEE